jgi:hypothetical protein
MSEEKNPLNVYNQLEIIRDAISQIETIHVYELATRQYGNPSEEELRNRVTELDVYVAKLNQDYQSMMDNYQSAAVEIERLQSINQKLVEANNTLIAENNLALENRQLTQDQADKIVSAYHKLPWVVKKFYGVN